MKYKNLIIYQQNKKTNNRQLNKKNSNKNRRNNPNLNLLHCLAILGNKNHLPLYNAWLRIMNNLFKDKIVQKAHLNRIFKDKSPLIEKMQ
jgi:hypothetical protein